MYRYHELVRWQFYEPFILLITLSFTCVYTAIFKKNYSKASVIAFLIFIPALIIYGYLSTLYNKKQEKEQQKIYTNLIVGKWNYRNRAVGNVIIVFNRDSTGYRFTDRVKTAQKFRYFIIRGRSLAIDIESNMNELYWIDLLTTKTLGITAGPFTEIKGNVYISKFTRGSP